MTHLLVRGDARRLPIRSGSVQCCITSPPYWGLRDYGIRGQLGLERTPSDYVAAMVAVFREVRRVLRDDGTLWLNLGDSYASGNRGGNTGHSETVGASRRAGANGQYDAQANRNLDPLLGFKPKDLIGIPWRVALALQADGWYLRSDIIWAKPNPMPESVTDRPTKAHEYLFLLTKSPVYYYDADAIREPAEQVRVAVYNGNRRHDDLEKRGLTVGTGNPSCTHPNGRNRRSVWNIATESYEGAHFATFPRALVEPCVKAGTSGRGCCPWCGAPWVRVVERGQPVRVGGNAGVTIGHGTGPMDRGGHGQWDAGHMPMVRPTATLGWRPSCGRRCPPDDPVPCVVLDPFGGAMTTLIVAEALGRRGVAVELSPEYLALGKRRLERPHARVNGVARAESLPLFDVRPDLPERLP